MTNSNKFIYKQIHGYEGLYLISNYGDIIGLKGQMKFLNPTRTKYGHLYTSLSKCGVVKKYYIHRLVALHFIPNPGQYNVVMHRDNDPKNNYTSNLKWGTQAMNLQQAHEEKRNPTNNLGQVMCIETGVVYENARQAGLKIGSTNIHRAIKNPKYTAGGFHWTKL